MRDNRNIVKFQQVCTAYGTGYMKFYNAEDQEIHTVTMEKRNGLWYTSNSILMPPISAGQTKRNLGASSSLRINKLDTGTDQMIDADVDAQQQFYAMENDTEPSTVY